MGSVRSKPNLFYRKAYSVTGAAPGSKHAVRLSEIENQLNGYPLTIQAIEIRATITYNASAATLGASGCPGLRMYRAIGNVNLGLLSAGHKFIRDVDGLALRHDSMRILGYEYDTGYSDIADADATGATTNRTIHIPFAHRANVTGAEDDGTVPLAVFRDSDLNIRVNDATAVAAGITVTSVSFEVWLVLKPTHKVFMPPAWEIRVISDTVKIIKDQGIGHWHYLDLIDHENALSMSLAGIYGNLKLSMENAAFDFRDPSELVYEQNYFARRKQTGYGVQSPTAPTFIPLVSNAFDMVSRQPRGPVRLEMASRQTSTTYTISRVNGFRDGKYVSEFLKLLGANPEDFTRPGSGSRLEVQTARGGASEVLWPSLPAAVVWPDCPFAGIREGRVFKSA